MRKKLKDVCMFYSGTGFPIQYQGQTKGEYPFYKVGDIANNAIAGKIYLELCNNYISSDVAKMIKGCILPKDTVVFAKIGEALKLNRRAITSCDCLIDNNAMGIAPKSDSLRIQYFYFCMKNLKMQTLAESTTVPSVRKTVLQKYEIEVPSLVEQEEIEKKLTLTQKIIENRRQELSYLDEIIKARFIEMFGSIHESTEYPYVAVKDLTDVISGGTPSRDKTEYWDGGTIPWVKTTELQNNVIIDVDEYITEAGLAGSSAKLVPAGTVLVAMYGQGKTRGMTAYLDIEATTNQACACILPSDKIDSVFLWKYFELSYDKLRSLAQGAGQPNLNGNMIKNFQVLVPPIEMQNEFVSFVHQVDKSKVAVQKALDETQILFDSLMQKYFG